MIEIERRVVDDVRGATRPHELHGSLQAALELELSTVPVYLAAYFSLHPGTNRHVGATLRSVVIEEMLHFAIVANVLNALGGRPRIDHPGTVPSYPGPLPMGVAGGLEVGVRAMSIEQCRTFMRIEEPDDPIGQPPGSDTTTIGEFYAAIVDKLRELGDPAFGRPTAPQVVSPWYPSDQLFAITDAESAARAVTVIVEQGEGTTLSPTEGGGSTELAHYYRFGEIVHGKRLVTDPGAPEGFSYTGQEVEFDAGAVYPMVENATLARYRDHPAALRSATQFCTTYRNLLVALQKTFSGTPDALDAAMGLMYELRMSALAMTDTADPLDAAHCLTPAWEYLAG